MTALLRAEVLRLVSRRVTRAFAAVALLIILVVVVRSFIVSDRDLAAARSRAVAAAERDQRQGGEFPPGYDPVRFCEEAKARGEIPVEEECRAPYDPANYYSDPRLFAKDTLPSGARGVAGGLAVAAFLVGASFIGAEWHHGTLQALLFWEPRRGRVLLAKAVALVGVVVAFTLLMQALFYGATFLTAATRGSTEGATGGLHISVLLTILRGLIVVSVTSLLGYAVAGLARVTAAALGAAFAYFVIIENLLRGLRPGWTRFLFTENVAAVLNKRIPVPPAHVGNFGEIFDGQATFDTLWGWRGAVTLTVYLAILLGVFYATFTRRDVT